MNLGTTLRKVVADALAIAYSREYILETDDVTAYDPETMQNVTLPPQQYYVKGGEQGYDARYMTGSNVESGDVFVTIAAQGLAVQPKKGMSLYVGNTLDSPKGEIVNVIPYPIENVMVGWTLHVRGVS